ncbi:hypothetical protein [Dactylosporangium sp. NPDC050588]|uniref:hypothetical protein n=1 Tax=Dactylosporangium sp. NPDC050588 TaxID=3157211 RepID=UPI0033EBA6B2
MTALLARRWRVPAVLAVIAVCAWVSWFTQVGHEWFTQAVALPVPALIAVFIAPTWRVGVPAVAALLVAAPALVLLSTGRAGVLRPPSTDWFVPYVLLALVAWAAGFAVRVRAAGPDARGTLLMIGGGVAALLLCVGTIVVGGGGRALPSGDARQWVHGDDLPDGVGLHRMGFWGDCETEDGEIVECPQATEFWATDGRPAGEIIAQLVGELRALGWPVTEQAPGFYVGCLPMRGVLTWDDSICAEVASAGEASLRPNKPNSSASVMLTLG